MILQSKQETRQEENNNNSYFKEKWERRNIGSYEANKYVFIYKHTNGRAGVEDNVSPWIIFNKPMAL